MASVPVVVLDTNVFVSGLLSPQGVPGAILYKFRLGEFEIATSKRQIQEIKDVLRRPSLAKALPKGTTKEVLRFFQGFKKLTRVCEPRKLPWDFKDLNDHFLLDLVVYSKAEFFVTGDKPLRALQLVGKCAVLAPSEFIAKL